MKKKQQAYTVIELLVGLVIVGLLMQIGLASYQDFNRRQLAISVARQLEGDLRLAQQHANSATKPSGFVCSGGESYAGVEFSMSSQTNYTISATCTNGNTTQIKSVNLPNEAVLIRPSDRDILFEPLAAGTDLTAETTIGVCAYGSETAGVKVTPTGEIVQVEGTTCSESGGSGMSPLMDFLCNLLGSWLFCLLYGIFFPGLCPCT